MPAAPQVTGREILIVDRPDSAQSEIRIGRIGPPRSTADYYPLLVTNTILGGSFTSRLMQNLREEHGYAYGARSSFDYRLSTGPFVASAAVQTDKTGPSLTEFFKELDAIGKTVTEAEVTKAKELRRALVSVGSREHGGPRRQARRSSSCTASRTAGSTRCVARLQAVTLADVRRVASQYIEPGKVAVVVVGDRKKVEAEVKALNLGPVKTVSVEEVFGPAK